MPRETRSGSTDNKDSPIPSDKLDFIINQIKALHSDLTAMKEEQKTVISSIESIQTEIRNINDTTKTHDSLIKENKVAILNIKENFVAMQQYTRMNCIDILGIPITDNENLINIIEKISDIIGFQFNKNMLDICHRIPSRRLMQNKTSPIICKFVRRFDKYEFLKLKKQSGDILTSDLGLLGKADKIYINETLSMENRFLFKEAKKLQKENKIKYVWSSNGKVLVRKSDGNPVIIVKNVESLNSI